ncbi:coiled-coil domain-containing protein 28A-like [Dendronephthya gigantea]|uniref:coiled-coil domain-containing protein 28A-like n=1 Tax=Dendronephthya gigantea TaxID=151771 RepID=UPI00106A0DAC|nr:coiled-coil domain-containing protein 28A-like [Dendronephthya gigantea]
MAGESSKVKDKRKLARTDRIPGQPQQHSFLTDPNDVKKMEKDLLDLMKDFNEGKLHAFGNEYTLEKMDQVRESQESLAQLHFELDAEESHRKEHEEVGRNRNLERLMKDLEKLSSSIQNLHQNDPQT